MNLYLIWQEINDDYETYDSAVVCAENEDGARKIHPCGFVTHVTDGKWMGTYSGGASAGSEYDQEPSCDWVDFKDVEKVKVKLIGVADKSIGKGVVLASFNAG